VNYLLDTNVISELRKGVRGDDHVRGWFRSLPTGSTWLSVLVVGELRRGIESIRRRDPRASEAIERWMTGLLTDYSDRILEIDSRVADAWGRMNVPDPLPAVDGLIGATAIVHDLTVATRNARDMSRTGARCLNPFAPTSST